MPEKKAKTPYPYPKPILEFQGDPEPDLSARSRNEYFKIEALIRTDTAFQAYKSGGQKSLNTLFNSRGIFKQEPLTDSHHKLLKPSPQSEINKSLAPRGFVDGHIDTTFTIRDLGVLMELPANTPFEGWPSGEEQCLSLLRNLHPRFLFLQIDVSVGSTKILKNERLCALLNERHEQFTLYERLDKTPFRRIKDWLKYFKCYDLSRIQGMKPDKLAHYVYRDQPDRAKAMERARTALDRAGQAITAAEANTPWPPIIK